MFKQHEFKTNKNVQPSLIICGNSFKVNIEKGINQEAEHGYTLCIGTSNE